MNARNRHELRELLLINGLVAAIVAGCFIGVFAVGIVESLA